MEQAEKLTRLPVPAMDEILGQSFPVLDQGFIRVVDYMGSDAAIVQAARVSYGAGTKKVSEDEGLIRFLMRHRHTTPLEMCELKLHVKVPMDTWRQWIRHRTANVNEYSTRYSIAIDDRQQTEPDQWRTQSKANKQGSSGVVDEWPGAPISGYENPGQYLTACESGLHKHSREVYEERLKFDVAREVARKDLPLSTYTEAYWKIDLHNLLHFLSLRMDAHAQLEIRSYADVIGNEIVSRWVPAVWEAFNDYRLNAMFLTARDIAIITSTEFDEAIQVAEEFGWLERGKGGKLKTNRERAECEAKLARLCIPAPWAILERPDPA